MTPPDPHLRSRDVDTHPSEGPGSIVWRLPDSLFLVVLVCALALALLNWAYLPFIPGGLDARTALSLMGGQAYSLLVDIPVGLVFVMYEGVAVILRRPRNRMRVVNWVLLGCIVVAMIAYGRFVAPKQNESATAFSASREGATE